MKKYVESLDEFGEEIQLYYKGEMTMKTFSGGVCTIIKNIVLLTMFVMQLKLIFTFGYIDNS
jgi:hypothetical protein